MPFRSGRSYSVPGGVVTRGKSGEAKTYSGKGKGPAGTRKVAEPTLATTPVTTVSSDGTVSTSGFSSRKAAKRATRRARASQKRVRRIQREVTPKISRRPATRAKKTLPPKPYTPPPTSRPKTFAGKPTAGAPTQRELARAQKANTLKTNRKGFVTTPRVRSASRELKKAKKAIKRSGSKGPLPGLGPAESRVARTVLRTGEKMGATKKELLAAAETGLVESGFKNYTNQAETDADSLGWRQERTSIYGADATKPKQGALNFFTETKEQSGGTAGELAANVQRPREDLRYKYDAAKPEAAALLSAYKRGKATPKQAKRLKKAKAKARKVGLEAGRRKPGGVKKLPGPFDGSRAMVRKILGSKVKGDKEYGHSSEGDHDPSQPNAYAQDIGSAGANPAEGEPPYSQGTVDRMVKNLRKMGADVPDLTLGQDNWEGVVDGYQVQILTIPHGSGPHIHTGARWTGESTAAGYAEGGGGTSFSTSDVAAYAQMTDQSVAAVEKRLRKGKLTGLQILNRLKSLGIAPPGASPPAATPKSEDSILSSLERKYGVAA